MFLGNMAIGTFRLWHDRISFAVWRLICGNDAGWDSGIGSMPPFLRDCWAQGRGPRAVQAGFNRLGFAPAAGYLATVAGLQ